MSATATQPAAAATAVPTALRSEPFVALNHHFGMLLGVEDFQTEQAYHRGQQRLATSWLHGAGVVWGLDVTADLASGEVRIAPGLAFDGAGAALHVDRELCLGLGPWFDAHAGDPGFEPAEDGGETTFTADVVLRFAACLSRAVPALTTPCDGATPGVAYSRVQETVEALLVPRPAGAAEGPGRSAADPAPGPYHHLRVLAGLDDPAGDDDPPGAGGGAAFHRAAVLDEVALRPATGDGGAMARTPAVDGDGVLLATLDGARLRPAAGGGWEVVAAPVDRFVRPVLVATTALQALVAAALAPAPAGGPNVDPSSVDLAGDTLTFAFDRPVLAGSLGPGSIVVTSVGAGGWEVLDVVSATPDGGGSTVTVQLGRDPGATVVRVVVRGTGATPVLGEDLSVAGVDFTRVLDRRQ
jgi:hypothetical protein